MASKDRGAATAGRVANQERQRIERSEVIQSGQVLAARQVGGEKQTKQVGETAEQASMRRRRLCRYVDLNLTRKGWIGSKRPGTLGATLEQLKDGPKLVSATETTTWIEFASP